jgi:glycosyltransferase involved in cell wall biosynthesis
VFESNARPLLTFAVVAFNQERFIREAIEGAFGQTYSPLEIILSDDCSEDGTFEIMRKLAAAYRGPHRVILNRNPVRRCLGGHVNRVAELSRGELIVGSAGDDVSLPQRTQAVSEAWEQSGRQATSIYSDYIQIDANGRTIQPIFNKGCLCGSQRIVEQKAESVAFVQTLQPSVVGCAHAFSLRLLTLFGGLPEDIVHEDEVLAFRSILAGRVFYINEPLVQYRLHENNLYLSNGVRCANLKSLAQEEDRFRRYFRNRETMYAAFQLDLEKAIRQGFIRSGESEKSAQQIVRLRRRFSLASEFLGSGFFDKCRLLRKLRNEGLSKTESRALVRRLIPRTFFLRLRLARNFAALAWSRSRVENQPAHSNSDI